MKTKLPDKIETVEQAKKFLKDLYDNGESYHPEDDAHEIAWSLDPLDEPNKDEADHLNKLMDDIYALPGNENYPDLAFDPCGYLMEFYYKENNINPNE